MTTANELFSPAFQIDPEKDYTTELVGEGKKFASTKDLARSVLEKDLFIPALQRELQEAREELTRRKTVEEALATLSTTNTQHSSPNGGNTPAGSSSAEPVQLDEETLTRRIRETVSNTIQATEAERSAVVNLNSVKAALEAVWGKDYASQLATVVEATGVSQEYLTNMAKTAPKAFLKLVGADAPVARQETPSLFTPSSAGVSTAALARTNSSNVPTEERYSYWQKVRKEDPNRYHSPAAAMARFEAAKKHGDAFFAS